MDTISIISVQRKSMPPVSRFSFVIILRYDRIPNSPPAGRGQGAGPGPHDVPATDCGSAIGIVHVVLVWRRRATTGL